ncbi:MAG: ATP-binding protein [Anaerolineae bacterium]|nr:ATP-binding protein [Anaerolineae bacterium]
MKEIALHILDLAENSIAAGARTVEITVEEDTAQDRLIVCVRDDGKGMDQRKLERLSDPFVTSRTTRVAGLGIPLFKDAAEACNGCLRVTSEPGKGTCVEAEFQHSHIDRMPLGDLAGTVLTLVVGYPEVHWVFHYQVDGRSFTFDDEPLKQALNGLPLTEPEVLRFVREMLEEGVNSVRACYFAQEEMGHAGS